MFLNTQTPSRVDLSLKHSFEHTSQVTCIAFSKDAKYLATGSFGYTHIFNVLTGAKVWALQEWKPDSTFPTPRTITAICFSHDTGFIATAGGKDIRTWDLKQDPIDKRDLLPKSTDWVTSLDYSSTGRFLAAASKDGTIRLWDMISMTWVLELPQRFGDLDWNTVVFSADDTIIGASANSGHAFTWESVTGTWENPEDLNIAQCPLNGSDAHITFVTDERTENLCRIAANVALFETTHKSDTTNQFSGSPATLKMFTEWPSTWDVPTSVDWSADNSWIISGDNSGIVQCWDQHGQVQFSLYPHSTALGNTSHTTMD